MKHTFVLGILASAALAQAQSSPALWIAMPYASTISKCASGDARLRQRYTKAIEDARRRQVHRVPNPVLSLLDRANEVDLSATTLSDAEKSACKDVGDLVASDSFLAVLRTQTALMFISDQIASCTKADRSNASKAKEAILETSAKLGLLISDATIMEISAQRPNASASNEICASFIDGIQGSEFLESYSEEGFSKLFQSR